MAETPLTELEAVNIILKAAGDSEVSSLGSDISGNAEATLDEVSREIQEHGWHFNREDNYEFSVAGDGTVTLPDSVASFDIDARSPYDVVQRGNRLYDKVSHSYASFAAGTISGTVIFIFPFDELPPTARRYIALEAAHRYQKRELGSDNLAGFTDEDLRKARALFMEAEGEQADHTIFDNYGVARVLDRHSGSEFV